MFLPLCAFPFDEVAVAQVLCISLPHSFRLLSQESAVIVDFSRVVMPALSITA